MANTRQVRPRYRRVLVCGGRKFADRKLVYSTLDSLGSRALIIIQGGATGADSLAADWAKLHAIPCLRVPADWNAGRQAGPSRNALMLWIIGTPDLVIAFPGGPGTAHMCTTAEVMSVPVRRVFR